jgi:hypothetical protein
MTMPLERKGFETIRLGHQPTAFIVVDHQRQRWQDTRVVLARLADTPQASVVVMSGQTGNVFQRNRRGNQPNRWVRRYPL